MNATKRLVLLVGVMFLCAGIVTAQQTTAKIFGVVQLEDSSLVPGVSVEATSPKLVGKTTAVTDENGTFRLMNLTPGVYKLVFSLQGFQTVIRDNILLKLEQTLNLKIEMKLGNIEEAVTITGKVAQIDVKSTTRGMTLTKEVFQSLPKGRNFDALINIVPGVVNESQLLGGTSVEGASGAENMYYVDGMSTGSLTTGRKALNVNLDFVDEVQFKASGYQAEFGGSMGGVLNVITRSGGNEIHGELIGFYSSDKLQGKPRQELDIDDVDWASDTFYYPAEEYSGLDTWNRYEIGANLGGYIIKDKLWFFGSFQPEFYQRDRTLDYNCGTAALADEQTFRRTEKTYNINFKLTSQPTKNVRFSASFTNNFYKFLGEQTADEGNFVDNMANHSANPTTDHNKPGFSYPAYTVATNLDLTLGNNALLSVRGGFFTNDQKDQQLNPAGVPRWRFVTDQPYNYIRNNNSMFPEIPAAYRHPSGWSSISAAQNQLVNQQLNQRYQVNTDFNYFMNLAGEHSFKTGFQFIRQRQKWDRNDAVMPYVMFAWDMELVQNGINYGRGKYGWYSIHGWEPDLNSNYLGYLFDISGNRFSAYLQDSWTINNKLTINAGVRGEKEYLPSYSADPQYAEQAKAVDFSWNFIPRLGFIYDWFGDSSFKLYGSFAIYQDVMKMDMAINSYGGYKWKSKYFWLEDWDFTKIGVNGNFPGKELYIYDYRPPNFEGTQPDLKPFSQSELSLGLEKQLKENLSFSGRVVYKHSYNAIEDAAVTMRNKFGNWEEFYFTTNPGSDWINEQYQTAIAQGQLPTNVKMLPAAKRDYIGVNLAVDKRFSNNWMGGISYTWSSLKGNYSGLVNADEDGRVSPNAERAFDYWWLCFDKNMEVATGYLPTDRTHVIKAYGSYVFPFGLTIGTVLNAMSGTPITEDWLCGSEGFFANGRGNLGRTPFVFLTNLFVEYNLKLGKSSIQVSLNIDNLFDANTARSKYWKRYLDDVMPSTTSDDILYGQKRLLANDWEPDPDATKYPIFNMPWRFTPPIQARLGFKFMF